jgi:hypothetical protein
MAQFEAKVIKNVRTKAALAAKVEHFFDMVF